MKTLADLKASYVDIVEFKDDYAYYIYKIDYKARKILNDLLGSSFVAVFRQDAYCGTFDKNPKGFSLDCETIYCVKENGKVIRFTNSEWGGIEDIS